jgi:hypothetical protein
MLFDRVRNGALYAVNNSITTGRCVYLLFLDYNVVDYVILIVLGMTWE